MHRRTYRLLARYCCHDPARRPDGARRADRRRRAQPEQQRIRGLHAPKRRSSVRSRRTRVAIPPTPGASSPASPTSPTAAVAPIYGCRAKAGTEACVAANNLNNGDAFRFQVSESAGTIGQLRFGLDVNKLVDKPPFATNGTGLVKNLNADRLDNNSAEDFVEKGSLLFANVSCRRRDRRQPRRARERPRDRAPPPAATRSSPFPSPVTSAAASPPRTRPLRSPGTPTSRSWSPRARTTSPSSSRSTTASPVRVRGAGHLLIDRSCADRRRSAPRTGAADFCGSRARRHVRARGSCPRGCRVRRAPATPTPGCCSTPSPGWSPPPSERCSSAGPACRASTRCCCCTAR